MGIPITHSVAASALVAAALLFPAPAEAFRCKNKIVREDMHEQQVIAICGQPTTQRQLGYAIRGYSGYRRVYPGGFSRRSYGAPNLAQEVIVTEYTYNFGPRKLMRRLVFEGGVLVSIETIGYGYIEK